MAQAIPRRIARFNTNPTAIIALSPFKSPSSPTAARLSLSISLLPATLLPSPRHPAIQRLGGRHQQQTRGIVTGQRPSAAMDYAAIKTPESCYVDFCLIPIGTGSVSVAAEVAEVQKVLKASGLKYTMHSAGTTVEGSWDEALAVVGKAHAVVHQRGVVRVQSSVRIGSRTDKKQTAEEKVARVERLLAEEKQ